MTRQMQKLRTPRQVMPSARHFITSVRYALLHARYTMPSVHYAILVGAQAMLAGPYGARRACHKQRCPAPQELRRL